MELNWEPILIAVLENVVPVIFLALASTFVVFLRKKGVKEEYIALANEAYMLFQNCVLNVNQTFVDILKAEGEFNEAAQEQAREMAKNQFINLASDEMKLAIDTLYASVDAWIDTVREATVWEAKKA